MKSSVLIIVILLSSFSLKAYKTLPPLSNLSQVISIQVSNEKLVNVLTRISKQGNFYFSYSGSIFEKDSLVSFSVQNKSIRDVLDRLFEGRVDYKESGKYVILRSTVKRFSIVPQTINQTGNSYFIDGFIVDEKTGEKIKDASIYEKYLLQSTLSDELGYFKLKFRGDHKSIILTASKETYRDTSILFLSTVKISQQGYVSSDDETIGSTSNLVERRGLGRFLVSSKQRIQSLNVPSFLANSPFQASFLPGLSSHGMLSSQVVNKGSLNIIGGYTAGVNGVEVAGVFNINKKDMHKLQVGGVLNIVGGAVNGLQVGGVMNTVMDSVAGIQVGGVVNDVRSNFEGVQVGGIFNHVKENFDGTQVSGIANIISGEIKGVQVAGVVNAGLKSLTGLQVAGVGNISAKNMRGVQISTIFNYAKRLEGWQIGLFNLADTSSGYSIGLLNVVRKGYHKIGLSSNEILSTNIAFKTGNSKLYSMLIGGMNISDTNKIFSAGYGLGHEFLSKKPLSVSSEISSQFLYLGNWNQANILNKAQLHLQYKVFKSLRVFAGPSYSVYSSNPGGLISPGYQKIIPPKNHHTYSSALCGWLGWNFGITLF